MHTASEMVPCAPAKSIIVRKVKYPLCFVISYVPLVTQHFGSRTAMHTKRNGAAHSSYIHYHLKSEVSITLCCRLCSTGYTAVQIENCPKSTSAIKTATMKNTDDFRYEGKPSCAISKLTLFAVSID